MNVTLSPEMEQLIRAKIESGRYASASEVVGEALRLLEECDEIFTCRPDATRTLIQEGWDAAKRGDVSDGDEVFDRLERIPPE